MSLQIIHLSKIFWQLSLSFIDMNLSASSGPCRALMLFSWREHFPTRKLRVNQFLLQTGETRHKQHYSCKTLNSPSSPSRVRQRCTNSVMWHCERPASHRLKTQCRRIRTPPVRAPHLAKCYPRGQLKWTWSFAAKDRHLLNSSKKHTNLGHSMSQSKLTTGQCSLSSLS